jgi:3-deoxy-manno-octulosonate cytidylyltransferase (CMP-KDO synthetase)
MKSVIIIPARMASSRLPKKPLIDILGKSLLERTFEQCSKAVSPDRIYVTTDHIEIYNHCKERGINVLMTSDTCLTGTDRIAEVAEMLDADIYINVQGDEPLINPDDILELIKNAELHPTKILNGFTEIFTIEDYQSRTVPKVVFREDGRLLYMSRSPIPGTKNLNFTKSYRQVCIYAFPKVALQEFASRKQKTQFEEAEDIEILRFLEMGFDVQMVRLSGASISVDVLADLEKVKLYLENVK